MKRELLERSREIESILDDLISLIDDAWIVPRTSTYIDIVTLSIISKSIAVGRAVCGLVQSGFPEEIDLNKTPKKCDPSIFHLAESGGFWGGGKEPPAGLLRERLGEVRQGVREVPLGLACRKMRLWFVGIPRFVLAFYRSEEHAEEALKEASKNTSVSIANSCLTNSGTVQQC